MTPRAVGWVALAALVLVVPRASAFCLGRTCDPSKEECETDDEDCVTSGVPLHWTSSCVTFDVQLDASPRSGIDAATTATVVERAFGAWLAADCGDGPPAIEIGTYGVVECHESRFNQAGRNANIVMFRDVTWPYPGAADTFGMTMLRYNKHTGELWDADVEINSAEFNLTAVDDGDRVDLQSILTHELGHFLGLAHPGPDYVDATMSPRWDGTGTTLRTLDEDDVAGICTLYPPGRAAGSSCEPLNGFSGECFVAVPPPPEGCASIARPGSTGAGLPAVAALMALAYWRRRSTRAARPRLY
jgi:matrixin